MSTTDPRPALPRPGHRIAQLLAYPVPADAVPLTDARDRSLSALIRIARSPGLCTRPRRPGEDDRDR